MFNAALKGQLQRLHKRLLPEDPDTGYLPYVWLVYLSVFLLPLGFGERPAWHFIACLALTPVFVALYFFTFWQSGIRTLLCIFAMLGFGMATAWFNAGASVFFIYAAAFCVQLWQPRKALLLVFLIAGCAGLYSYLLDMPGYFYFPAIVISILIGSVNIYEGELRKKNQLLKVSQEDLRKMAANAERERIARDLHDVIGHTFSLITVKAQLAYKLADIDLPKSKQEIKELEQLSRSAMAEVRETVHSYQHRDMTNEIAKARLLAESAEIQFQSEIQDIPMQEDLNNAFAWVIREAFTNITKHAEATRCLIRFLHVNDGYQLYIENDGVVNQVDQEGSGLTSARERINAVGGKLTISADTCFVIKVEVPHD